MNLWGIISARGGKTPTPLNAGRIVPRQTRIRLEEFPTSLCTPFAPNLIPWTTVTRSLVYTGRTTKPHAFYKTLPIHDRPNDARSTDVCSPILCSDFTLFTVRYAGFRLNRLTLWTPKWTRWNRATSTSGREISIFVWAEWVVYDFAQIVYVPCLPSPHQHGSPRRIVLNFVRDGQNETILYLSGERYNDDRNITHFDDSR